MAICASLHAAFLAPFLLLCCICSSSLANPLPDACDGGLCEEMPRPEVASALLQVSRASEPEANIKEPNALLQEQDGFFVGPKEGDKRGKKDKDKKDKDKDGKKDKDKKGGKNEKTKPEKKAEEETTDDEDNKGGKNEKTKPQKKADEETTEDEDNNSAPTSTAGAIEDALSKQKEYANQVAMVKKVETDRMILEKIAKEKKQAAQEASDKLASYTATAEEEAAKVVKAKEAAEKAAKSNLEAAKDLLKKASDEKLEADKVVAEKTAVEKDALQKYAIIEAITKQYTAIEPDVKDMVSGKAAKGKNKASEDSEKE